MNERYCEEYRRMYGEVEAGMLAIQESVQKFYKCRFGLPYFRIQNELERLTAKQIETLDYYILIFRQAADYFRYDVARESSGFLDLCYAKLQDHYFYLALALDDQLIRLQCVMESKSWSQLME